MADPFTAFTAATRAALAAAVAGAPAPPTPTAAAAAVAAAGLATLAASATRAAAADALAPSVSAAWSSLERAVAAADDATAAAGAAEAVTGLADRVRAVARAAVDATAPLAADGADDAGRAVLTDAAAAFAAGGDGAALEEALTRFYAARLASLAAAADADAPFEEGGEDGDDDGDDDDGMDWAGARPRTPGTQAGAAAPPSVPPLDAAALLGPAAAHQLASVASAAATLGVSASADAAVAAAACAAVRARAAAAAARGFTRRALPPVRRWAASVPPALLAASHAGGGRRRSRARAAAAARWAALLDAHAHEAVGDARAAQLFDIVVDWPDSGAAVADVAAAVAAAPRGLRARVGRAFAAATRARLLHAGAATGDVIAQYVATVRALGGVEGGGGEGGRGGLLARVGAPVRAHLRARPDTVRCVVGALAGGDDGGALPGLLDECGGAGGAAAPPPPAPGGAESDGDGDGDAARLRAGLAWHPPPRPRRGRDLAKPAHATKTNGGGGGGGAAGGGGGGGDAVGLLVSIFGGPDVLAAEYRHLLAARLLAAPSGFDADAHVRTLELLRARFGDGGLHGADVMLKDVADSRRARDAVAALPPGAAPASPPRGRPGEPPLPAAARVADGTTAGGAGGVGRLSALITSAVFWPPLPRHPAFALPPAVAAWMESYAARYYVLKAPRRLVWAPGVGVATLKVTIAGRARTFTAAPLEAAALLRFGEAASWTLPSLAAALEVDEPVAARAVARWVGAGVVVEGGGGGDAAAAAAHYTRAAAMPVKGRGAPPPPTAAGDDDEDGAGGGGGGGAAAAAAAAADAVAAGFVVGMLTNFEGGLPPARIHAMLKMFATDPPYDKSMDQLIALLDSMVADERLTLDGGVYKKRV